MALGGGIFKTMDKVLPGTYTNFASAGRAADRVSSGIVAVPMIMDWGDTDSVIEIKSGDFEQKAVALTGYTYDDDANILLRELFKHASYVLIYRLNRADAVKAAADIGTARYGGTCGNKITVTVHANVDRTDYFDVATLYDGVLKETQTVQTSAALKDNDFVIFDKTYTLVESAGMVFEKGANGTAVTGDDYSMFLAEMETQTFNTLVCDSVDEAIKKLFVAFTKRMRDEMGVKFQTVVYKYEAADHEGIVSLDNSVIAGGIDLKESAGVYWLSGALAACELNADLTNKLYDGELSFNLSYTQGQLERSIGLGQFVFHRVGKQTRTLKDINTFTSYAKDKNSEFSRNKTIRVIDYLANEEAYQINNEDIGTLINDELGRTSLWNRIVNIFTDLQDRRAIQNFSSDQIVLNPVEGDKYSVAVSQQVEIIGCVEKVYITTVIV